jgi:hypothetical protein
VSFANDGFGVHGDHVSSSLDQVARGQRVLSLLFVLHVVVLASTTRLESRSRLGQATRSSHASHTPLLSRLVLHLVHICATLCSLSIIR